MEKEASSDGSAAEENNIASHDLACQSEMSNRMKQLLHGVRLSMAAELMNPADDLEELARRLDIDRRRRSRGI